MENIKDLERHGIDAVLKLRRTRLARGDFFMINTNSLPDDQCYLEYPEGTIKLAVYELSGKKFTILRELENEESSNLRKKFNLELIQ